MILTLAQPLTRRGALAFLLSPLIATQSGCALKQWFVNKTTLAPHAAVLAPDASLEEITDHLNRDRACVIGWRSSNVRITATGEGILQPRLSATVSVQSPRSLRIVAGTALTGSEVDFGANDERYWVCIKRQEPRVIMTGSHARAGQQDLLPIPIQPAWLMETLGVVPLDTTDARLEHEAGKQRVLIVSPLEVDHRTLKRVLVVDLREGHVVEHRLYDESDRLTAKAVLSAYRQAPNGAMLPHEIVLEWPQTKSGLTLQIDRMEINPSVPESTWEMPKYANYEVVDVDRMGRQRL